MTTPHARTERIEFVVNLPPSGLRRNRLARDHGYRARLTREYAEQVWCAGRMSTVVAFVMAGTIPYESLLDGSMAKTPTLPWESARVHYRWHSTHQSDEDNIIASMKAALDVLGMKGARPLGIIVDDRDATVTAEWVRERVRSKEHVLITITRALRGGER